MKEEKTTVAKDFKKKATSIAGDFLGGIWSGMGPDIRKKKRPKKARKP